MLYTLEAVQANLRNRDGKRVFYLGAEDRLTPGARDFLQEQRIPILSGEQAAVQEYRLPGGGFLRTKPEHMTHLHSDLLVPKTHGRIRFRGAMDTLEAELILCQLNTPAHIAKKLEELLEQARQLLACEVLEKPVAEGKLLGMDEAQLRSRSHRPQDYYGQPHFMPNAKDGPVIAHLNRCRCAVRNAELAAAQAFETPEGTCQRPDILKALNRMSSAVYLLMIEEKAKQPM